eukprot:TRINITY_DN5548_c0_g2_i1.p2 TRINITY_DN5548_c0_g2~~TRINITY_DN5548_c0_g2_i1.p2  ORF type:complete len:143 (-),score=48.46 TRINITY_DN5548_c0_g2_i1:18-446(-)
MLLFVLGQFLRQRALREYTARIMYDTFRQLECGSSQRKEMFHWVVVGLPNYAQVEPRALSRWMTTCVLLSCTRRAPLAQLLVALLASRTPHVHARVLEIAALSFIADDDLDGDDRDSFLATISADNADPAFQNVVQLLEGDE